MDKKLVYLASPYTHSAEGIRTARFYAAAKAAAWAMETQGVLVYCAIAHTHPIAEKISKPLALPFDFWSELDFRFVKFCDEFWILCIEGWQRSVGVRCEAQLAFSESKPVRAITVKCYQHKTNEKDYITTTDFYEIHEVSEAWMNDAFQE
jgi:hypothetical protein